MIGFLGELEQCGLDPVKVAKTFVKNNAGFSIYTDYCTNYPRTVSVLTELMRQDMTVRLFRERQGALQHTLPLGSYLLKPVQRILKYHLLLQNIVKHFGKDSEGYRDIADALSAMTGIAHHINDMKRRHEHAIRVQEIQSLLYGWEDRFGSWRRKSEPSYSSKSSSPRGHLSIYVSPDFIERSTDSLVEKPRKDECTADEDNSYDEIMTGVSKKDHSGNLEDDMDINENKSSKESLRIESPSPSQGNEEECHEESLEEIVGQLVRQSRQFQRMLMKQHQKSRGGSASRSRNHSREHQRSDETSLQNGYSLDDDAESMRNSPCVPDEEPLDNQKQNTNSNTFRAQRQAHMRALREEQKMSSIPKISLQNESPKKQSDDYMSLSFSEGVLKKVDDVPIEGITPSDDARKSSNINDNYFGNYDNLQNVWESVRKAEKEKREAAALGENPPFASHKEESPSWSHCGIAPHMGTLPCIPTLPAVWLKQQEGHLATPNLKSGSLPRGFQLGQPQRQLPQPQAQRCSAFDVSPSSTLSHPETCSHNDEGYSSSLFRMERPFTIASESPGRADEIDFEDIEQYMAETGRSGVGMSFLPPRFPLPPLQDADGQEVAQEDDDEEDEEVVDENSSTAHINVHPEYRVYRPIVSKAALRHVISSVSSKLANLRVGISSGGITTEDEEEVEEGEDEYPGERTNTRGRSRRRMGNSFSSSTESNIAYGTRGGHVSGGESESEASKSGSRLVYTLARQYSKSLKERIRSIMTMNVIGVNNAEEDTDCFKEGESENQMSDNFMSQDSLNLPNTNNRTSPVKNTSPPVTYHKQGSSSLGARIAHGGDAAEYATPHIRGITDRVNQKESISPRPDSLLSATSSAFTSSSDGDKVTCNQESRIINLEPCSEGSDSSRKMNSEEEDDDNEDCGGSGDSYYERSFEAIESFLGDPSMTCTIVGDTFRDSAIFSDHEEIELIMSRVTETSKTFLQPTKPTPVRIKIPPPVPAKPSASSIALATSVAQSAQCLSSMNGGDQNCNEVHQVLRCSTLERTPPSQVNAQQNSTVQNQLLGVKSVKERRKELEMWRNSMDVSGCCEKGAVDVPKYITQKMEQSIESGRPGALADRKTGAIQDIECEEGGATPKGWVRHCSNLMLIESVPGEPLSFHVIPFDNPRLQYTLQARNLEQKREWTLQLKRVILENYNAVIPTHARQLVMELGQNRTDGYAEYVRQRGFHGKGPRTAAQTEVGSARKTLTLPST
ncbi:hypothetical protein J437_LFUL006335 [Ladona fulva]|uniref:DH domain-containing protein n=1 Tax=Ladona fulva TaxID=123851 RepID=A0A8K0NYI8_LADFU|nr:hypothetical protein J437_LFUL006335 [Ladona fulva]